MEVCESPSAKLVGVKVQVRPVGVEDEVSVTVPVKLFTGAIVMVEFARTFVLTLTVVGLAIIEKSVTMNVIFTV